MKENELHVFSGDLIYKFMLEYFNDTMFTHGYPYYMINKVDGVYYLWELDRTNPDSRKYLLINQGENSNPLYEQACELERKLRRQLYPDPLEEWKRKMSEMIK